MKFKLLSCMLMGLACMGHLGFSSCRLPIRSLLYVTIAGESEVVVIDEKSGQIQDQIAVGAGPAIIIATPDQKKAYTANWGDNTVSTIDTASHQVTHIALGSRPYVIAMAPDGKRVYAGLYANRIEVIDTATDTVERTFATSVVGVSSFTTFERIEDRNQR
jgi:YVTN family beta-propeller protein